MTQTIRRSGTKDLDTERRRMWVGWVGLVTRYDNSNLSDVVVRDGFPVEIGDFEAEYYFSHSGETVEDASMLLEEAQWKNFIRFCRTIRNGTISSLKIRERRPATGRSTLPRRFHRKELESILADSQVPLAEAATDLARKMNRTGLCPGGRAVSLTRREGSDASASSGGSRRGPSAHESSLN